MGDYAWGHIEWSNYFSKLAAKYSKEGMADTQEDCLKVSIYRFTQYLLEKHCEWQR